MTKKTNRALRRHHRERMIRRAYNIRRHEYEGPDDLHFTWTDYRGNTRHGLSDWDDVHDIRHTFALMNHDNLALCSCWMCGNPRRFPGPHKNKVTIQEYLADLDMREQLDDLNG